MRKAKQLASLPSGLADSVFFHLEMGVRLMLVRAEVLATAQLNLSLRACRILQAAGSVPQFSQGAIADVLGINRNVMVQEVDLLESAGYLRRKRKDDNRREMDLTLTAKGRKTVEAIDALFSLHVERTIFHPATATERAILRRWARDHHKKHYVASAILPA